MSIISFKQKGDFKNTEKLLKKSFGKDYKAILEKYALQGVRELAANTPMDTGLTAASWTYDIVQNGSSYSIIWNNLNVNRGVNIAVILQYGHATRNGGYVQGRDYINPALQPIFDEMAEAAWKEVTSI
jgi:hypothetical protein